jgi:platelet-activating factor acetylhydrolase
MRVSEIEKALNVLNDINSSEPIKNLRQSQQPVMDWSSWNDSIQIDKNVTMAGHSFGAATVIETLRDARFGSSFQQGICLDPVSWLSFCLRGLLFPTGV